MTLADTFEIYDIASEVLRHPVVAVQAFLAETLIATVPLKLLKRMVETVTGRN